MCEGSYMGVDRRCWASRTVKNTGVGRERLVVKLASPRSHDLFPAGAIALSPFARIQVMLNGCPVPVFQLFAKRAQLASCILTAAVLAACSTEPVATRAWTAADHGQPPGAVNDDGRAAPAPVQPEEGGQERAAQALWNVSCASCHGRQGRGDGASPPPGAQMPNFTDPAFQGARSDNELAQAIREGRGMMPAFDKQLSPNALQAMVGQVRRFGQKKPPANNQAPTTPLGAMPAGRP